jgi:hypothetical protein
MHGGHQPRLPRQPGGRASRPAATWRSS